jgi:NitT/TauT family transport system substrate-binding protein
MSALRMRMETRGFAPVSAALASVIFLLAGANTQAAELQKLRMSQAVDSVAYVAVDYARVAGFYAAEGLAVEQIISRGGGPDVAALVSGDVEFNTAAPSYQLNTIRQGRDVILIDNYIKSMNQSLVVSSDAAKRAGVSSDAPTADRLKALKGMTLGITQPGAMTDQHIRFLLRKGGVEVKDVKLVAIGSAQALMSALETKQIDGFAISLGPDRTAVARGAVMWVDNLRGDVGGLSPFPMVNLYTTKRYADANPQIVRKLVRATQRAVKDLAEKSPEDVARVLQARYSTMDPQVLLLCVRAFKPALNPQGNVTREMVDNLLAFEGVSDISRDKFLSFYTDRFLKD